MTPKTGRRIFGVLMAISGVYDLSKGGSEADLVAAWSIIAIGALVFFWGAWRRT